MLKLGLCFRCNVDKFVDECRLRRPAKRKPSMICDHSSWFACTTFTKAFSIVLFYLSIRPCDYGWYSEHTLLCRSKVMQTSTRNINKFSPLIIYLDFEATTATHKLIKKRIYRQSCGNSDWLGFSPFSEIINADNKMAAAIHLRERVKRVPWDWSTMHLIVYVRWQTTLSSITITFLYVVCNIAVNPIHKEKCEAFFSYVGVLSRLVDIAFEWLVSPDSSWILWMMSSWRSLSAMTSLLSL